MNDYNNDFLLYDFPLIQNIYIYMNDEWLSKKDPRVSQFWVVLLSYPLVI